MTRAFSPSNMVVQRIVSECWCHSCQLRQGGEGHLRGTLEGLALIGGLFVTGLALIVAADPRINRINAQFGYLQIPGSTDLSLSI